MIVVRRLDSIAYQNSDLMFHYLGWIEDGNNYELDNWHGWLSETERGNLPIGPTLLCEWRE